MTDEQRVGQLFVVGLRTNSDPAALDTAALETASRLRLGNYLLYGGSSRGVTALKSLTRRVDGRLTPATGGVRPFVAADQEGGAIQPLTGPGFDEIPSALVQGTWPADRVRTSTAHWGRQLRAAGVNLDFAPVADVVPASLGTRNQPIGRYRREYGHTPAAVSEDVAAAVSGWQSAGLVATAKHFPGLGRVIGNTDVARNVTDPLTGPGSPDLAPFRAAVDAGVGVVMLSSAHYPAIDPHERAVFSAPTVALLRERLGFTGLIASDDLGAAEQVLDVPPAERALRFLRAGGQLLVVVRPPSVFAPMVTAVLAAARSDPAFRARVEAAATAVLQAKERSGLLTC